MLPAADSFCKKVDALAPSPEGIVLGVSGGVDSVVLWHLLLKCERQVVALHLNYGLRGEASDRDEAFVRTLAGEWSAALVVEDARLSPEQCREWGVLGAARRRRDESLAREAVTRGFRFAATAHNADDQVETLLLNLFRGAGNRGLAGMQPVRSLTEEVSLIRPLLSTRRQEIEAYAREQGLEWREDTSNRDLRRSRAFLRSEILPRLVEHFGDAALDNAAAAVSRSSGREAQFPGMAIWEGDSFFLPIQNRKAITSAQAASFLAELLPEMPRNAAIVKRVAELTARQVGARVEAGQAAVWRDRNGLRFVPKEIQQDWSPVHLEPSGQAQTAAGRFIRLAKTASILTPPDIRIPSGAAFELRPWRAGDRFHEPDGTAHRLVADLLSEARVAPHRKQGWPVVASHGRVVAIPGVKGVSEQSGDILVWIPPWTHT